MDPRTVVFVLNADPKGVERLGAFLPDGCLVDLQAAHVSMRGRPSHLLRDRTAYRLAQAEAQSLIREIVAWVDSQRPPGTALRPEHVRVVDDRPEAGAPPMGRRPPP